MDPLGKYQSHGFVEYEVNPVAWRCHLNISVFLVPLNRYIIHSPTTPSFLTCSDDYRARFWHRRANVQS